MSIFFFSITIDLACSQCCSHCVYHPPLVILTVYNIQTNDIDLKSGVQLGLKENQGDRHDGIMMTLPGLLSNMSPARKKFNES